MIQSFLLFKTILVLVIFTVTLLVAAYSTYAERKVAAFLQEGAEPQELDEPVARLRIDVVALRDALQPDGQLIGHVGSVQFSG